MGAPPNPDAVGSVDGHLVLPAGWTGKPSACAFANFIGAVFSDQKIAPAMAGGTNHRRR
jgi:hypothetical protein